jgi:neutral ceramidase
MSGMVKAGVSTIDISPRQGVELAGYPHCPRYNTGIHDPLFASCLCLDDGQTALAIVTMDLLMLSRVYVQRIRSRVAALTGLLPGNIMLSCSHTHSGPWTSGRLDLESLENGLEPDTEYMADLQDKLVWLIGDAMSHQFDARVGVGLGRCGSESGVGGNRRTPDGIADPEVWTIGVQDLQGNWKACYLKYALHPTLIHAESTVVTADYPGYIREYLAAAKPGIVTLFAQGTSGNQSTRYFRNGQTFEEAKRIGKAIGAETDRVLDRLELSSNIRLCVGSIEVNLGLRKLPPRAEAEKLVTEASDKLEAARQQGRPYIETQNAELNLFGAENTLGYILQLEKGRGIDLIDDELPTEIQVIGIDDTRIVGLPGEAFVEFGLAIRAGSSASRTFVVELTNGCLPGYACTSDAYAQGGYEAGASMLDTDAGNNLVRLALQLLSGLS